jgi:Transglutaminase-like superfamily
VTAKLAYPSRLHGPAEMAAYRGVPLSPRWSVATLRSAVWTYFSLRVTARRLRRDGAEATVGLPPRVGAGGRRGVEAVLRRVSPTCLERSMVLQKWLLANGVPCEVVIGVKRGNGGVEAHAWLDVEADLPLVKDYTELHRLGPR